VQLSRESRELRYVQGKTGRRQRKRLTSLEAEGSLRARMSRRLRGALLPGSIACLISMPAALALTTGACGDDTILLLPEGGGVDATTSDVGIDTSAGEDAGCTAFDAGGLDDAQVQAGKTLVLSLKCAKCHGDLLSGNPDGVASPETEGGLAYPPNLTPDPATGLGCWTNDQIENAFLNGIDNEGNPLCPPMPHFADAGVDASGALDIVSYLRSLPAVVMNVPNTPSCTLGPTDAGGGGQDASDGSAGDAGDGGAQDASDATVGDASDATVGDASDAGVGDSSAGGDDGGDASPE